MINITAFAAMLMLVAPLSWAANAPTAAATIAETQGSPQVLLDGLEPWTKAAQGQQLSPGTQLKTGARESALLLFADGSKVHVGPRAQFTLEEASPAKISLFVGLGKIECWVAKFASRNFQARSPAVVAAVRGTVFSFNVLSPKKTIVDLFSGSLAINDAFGRSLQMNPGQRVEASLVGLSKPVPLPPADRKAPEEPAVGDLGDKQPLNQDAQSEPVPPPDGEDQETTYVPPPPPPPSALQNQLVSPSSP